MAPTQELIDAIYRGNVLRARAMSPEERLSEGFTLFATGCEVAKAGIRARYPLADEAEVLRILRERIALIKTLEDAR